MHMLVRAEGRMAGQQILLKNTSQLDSIEKLADAGSRESAEDTLRKAHGSVAYCITSAQLKW